MDAAPSAPLPRRRLRVRLRWVLLTLVLLLVAASIVAAVVVSRSYGPIEWRGGGFAPGDPTGRRAVIVTQFGIRSVDAFVIDARRAGSHTFEFDMQNTGRLPLTLERLEVDDEVVSFFSDLEISRSSTDGAGGVRSTWIPIAGAQVAPGEYRTFRATITWSREVCPEGSSPHDELSLVGIPVRYGYGPFSRSQQLVPPVDVVLLCGPPPRER